MIEGVKITRNKRELMVIRDTFKLNAAEQEHESAKLEAQIQLLRCQVEFDPEPAVRAERESDELARLSELLMRARAAKSEATRKAELVCALLRGLEAVDDARGAVQTRKTYLDAAQKAVAREVADTEAMNADSAARAAEREAYEAERRARQHDASCYDPNAESAARDSKCAAAETERRGRHQHVFSYYDPDCDESLL